MDELLSLFRLKLSTDCSITFDKSNKRCKYTKIDAYWLDLNVISILTKPVPTERNNFKRLILRSV